MVVNPEVEEIADVEIMKQEVVYIRDVVCSPENFNWCGITDIYGHQRGPYWPWPFSVRLQLKISPKNGALHQL